MLEDTVSFIQFWKLERLSYSVEISIYSPNCKLAKYIAVLLHNERGNLQVSL